MYRPCAGPPPDRGCTIKAISIRQPWAELIVSGQKDVESRHWSTDYRGPILVHAAKRVDVPGANLFPVDLAHCTRANDFGKIVGAAFLFGCSLKQRSDWHEDGDWGWYLADPVRLAKPIELTGQLRLFEVQIENLADVLLCRRCKSNLPGPQSGLCGCCYWWLKNHTEKIAPHLPHEHWLYREFLTNALIEKVRG